MNVYEIDYLGTKPNNWKTKKFRQVFRFYKGLGITKDDLIEEGIPVISYGQVHSKDNFGFGLCDSLYRFVSDKYLQTDKKCLVHEGDFIFADTSEDYDGVGNCAFIDRNEDIFAGYHSMVASPIAGDTIYGKYFAFQFMTDFWRSQIRAEVMGIKVFSITQKLLRDTVIMIPPKEEQQAIADFLEEKCKQIDGIISDIEKQIEILKSYKKSLITETVTKGLDKNVKMKDSGVEWIGEIPEHWDVSKIKYIASFHNGDRSENYPSGDEIVDDGVIFVTSNNIHDVVMDKDKDCKFITPEKYSSLRGAKLKIDDIVYCLRGSVGICAINKTDSEGTVASSLTVIRSEHINPEYLNYSLHSEYELFQTDLYTNGSCAANLSAENVGGYYIVVPDEEEQDRIINYLDSQCTQLDSIINTKQTQLTQMQQHKKSLIYEYVTGKKRVQGFGN